MKSVMGTMDSIGSCGKIDFPSIKHNTSKSKINFDWSIKFKGFDSDGDGVLDSKDCKPFDKTRQHFKPNKTMMQDLKKLPILFYGGNLDRTFNPRRAYTIDGYYLEDGKLMKADRIPKNVMEVIRRFYMIVKERPDVLKPIRQRKTWVIFTMKGDGYGFVPLHGSHATVHLKGVHGKPFGYHSGKGSDDFMYSDVQEGAGTIHHELEHIKQFQTGSPSKWVGSQKAKKRARQKTKEEKEARKAESKAELRRYRQHSQKKFMQGVKSHLSSMDVLSR